MSPSQFSKYSHLAVRIVLAAILLYAGWRKALDSPKQSEPTIFSNWSKQPPVRWVAICGELALGVWLISGVESRAATIVFLIVISSFTGLIVVELGKEFPVPCGCSGGHGNLMDPSTVRASLRFDVLRNLLLIVGAAWSYLLVPVHKPRWAFTAHKIATNRKTSNSLI